MADTHWRKLNERYAKEAWTKIPSIFAEEVRHYIPDGSTLLELGCGQGQDGLWFAADGTIKVVATDNEPSALESAAKQKVAQGATSIEFERLDMAQPFSYADNTFDVVYSHLALHYFDKATTEQIVSEIYRILRPGGLLVFLVNSINDPEYNTGVKLEDDYFETEGIRKRYFSAAMARKFTRGFDSILCDEEGETYKDTAKGVHHLVRFVGRRA